MDKCDARPSRWRHLKRALPTLILILLTALAGGTDLFSSTVQAFVSKSLSDRLHEAMPYLLDVLLVATALNLAWLAFHPLSCWLDELLESGDVADEVRPAVTRAFALAYWSLIGFLALGSFAPDLMGKLAVGVGFITAALAWAMSGILNDLASGFLLRGMRCLKEGELVKVSDVSIAEGTVVSIGWLRTLIKNPEVGEANIPNSKIWQSPIAKKAKKSLLFKADGTKDK